MKINQALKEKNRLAGKLTTLNNRLSSSNRWPEGNKPGYDAVAVLKEKNETVDQLIDIKRKITLATVPAVGTILKIAELKSSVSNLKSLPTQSGVSSRGYGSTDIIKYEVAITEVERDKMVEEQETAISKLQDELDHFNATTNI